MADKIIVRPTEQSPIVVSGSNSGTPVKVNTDIDYSLVNKIIDKEVEPLKKKLEEVESLVYASL